MDIDALVIERFYNALKQEHAPNILPLISNVADPTPNLGWRGLERKALSRARHARPDISVWPCSTMWLSALIFHSESSSPGWQVSALIWS